MTRYLNALKKSDSIEELSAFSLFLDCIAGIKSGRRLGGCIGNLGMAPEGRSKVQLSECLNLTLLANPYRLSIKSARK